MSKILCLLLVLPCLAFGAVGKNSSKKTHVKSWVALNIMPFEEKELKMKGVGRSTASESSYNSLVTSFSSLKTANDLEKFINQNEQLLKSSSDPSTVFLLSHVVALKPLRGIIWRSRSLFEAKGSGNRLSHSLVVSQLKSVASNLKIFNPEGSHEAVIDYLVAPYSDNGKLPSQFTEESDLQGWMMKSLKPSLLTLKNRINNIPLDAKVVWNQQIFFGKNSFVDGVGRDVIFGGDEVQALISSYEINLAQLDMFCAYYQDGAINFAQDFGKLYGFDGFLFNNVDGVTGKEISQLLKKPEHSELWKLNENIGLEAMKEAGVLFASAVNRMDKAWERFNKDSDRSSEYLLTPDLAKVGNKVATLTLMNAKRVVRGDVVRSSITGELVQFNAPKFFSDPPADLKVFYPTSFYKNKKKEVTLNVDGRTKKYSYRDYFDGTPNEWNVEEYKKYFNIQSNNDISRSLKVVNHSLSGFAIR